MAACSGKLLRRRSEGYLPPVCHGLGEAVMIVARYALKLAAKIGWRVGNNPRESTPAEKSEIVVIVADYEGRIPVKSMLIADPDCCTGF